MGARNLNPIIPVLDFARSFVNGDRRRGQAAWRANDAFVHDAPSPAQTVGLFAGEWASELPIPGAPGGSVNLFDDPRIHWLVDRLGGVGGMDVLELGPLEAGHTTMLSRAGAASVLAIEANKSAYLRCLIVKELLGLPNARFELGDFDAYLAGADRRFDLLLASGVLYHMADPLRTLLDMVKLSDRIFVWSHFVDRAAMPPGDRRWRPMTGEVTKRKLDGHELTYHVRSYRGTEAKSGFCGGTMSRSIWMEKDEVLRFFRDKGYDVETAFEEPASPAGPALCMLAQRR